MNPRPRPLASFWAATGLLAIVLTPLVMSAIATARGLEILGAVIFVTLLPAIMAGPVLAMIILVGLWRHRRWAIIAYMVLAPFWVISSITTIAKQISPSGIPGYGTMSTLIIMGFLLVNVVVIGVAEYTGWQDLRRTRT